MGLPVSASHPIPSYREDAGLASHYLLRLATPKHEGSFPITGILPCSLLPVVLSCMRDLPSCTEEVHLQWEVKGPASRSKAELKDRKKEVESH